MATNALQPPPGLARLMKNTILAGFDASLYLIWQAVKNLRSDLDAIPVGTTFAETAVAVTTSTDILKVTAPVTITLQTAIGIAGTVRRIDNASSGLVPVITTGTETIAGSASEVLNSGSFVVVYSDGANWRKT